MEKASTGRIVSAVAETSKATVKSQSDCHFKDWGDLTKVRDFRGFFLNRIDSFFLSILSR